MKLLLKKNGLIEIMKQEENSDEYYPTGNYIAKDSKDLSILFVNSILENGFTLKDYFKIIIEYPIFQLLDSFFGPFIEEFNLCQEDYYVCSDIDYITLQKVTRINIWNDNSIDDEIENYIDVYGYNEKTETCYAIDLSSLKEIIDIPLKLGNHIFYKEIYNLSNSSDDKNISEEYETQFSLLDIIHSIIWELSFYGIPERRNKIYNELKESYLEIQGEKI